MFTQLYGYNLLCLSQSGLHVPHHSICLSPDNAFPVEEGHSCILPEICLATTELKINLKTHTHKTQHACCTIRKRQGSRVTRKRLGWKKAFFHMFLLSDLHHGRLCFGLSFSCFLSQKISVMGTDLRGWAHKSLRGKKTKKNRSYNFSGTS